MTSTYAVRDVIMGVFVFSIAVVAIGLLGWALPNIPHTGPQDSVIAIFINAAGYLMLAAFAFLIGISVVIIFWFAAIVGNRIRHGH